MQHFIRTILVRCWLWCAMVLALAIMPGALLAQDVVRPAQSDPTWAGEYFNNATLSGTPVLTHAQIPTSTSVGAQVPRELAFPTTAFPCAGHATSTSLTMVSIALRFPATTARGCLSTTRWPSMHGMTTRPRRLW